MILQRQLKEKHQKELQEFYNFQTNLKQIMQARHEAERLAHHGNASYQGLTSHLAHQHKQEIIELEQAKTFGYKLLRDKQAKEKAKLS